MGLKKNLFCFLLLSYSVFSQKTIEFYDYISVSNIKEAVSVLAADSLQGRKTGEEGQKKAASFIAVKLNEYRCRPFSDSYYLPVELIRKKKSASIKIAGVELHYPKNVGFTGEYQQHREKISGLRMVKLSEINQLEGNGNYGIVINDYNSFDISQLSKTFKGSLFFFTKKYYPDYYTNKKDKGLAVLRPVEKPLVFFINYQALPEGVKKNLNKKEFNFPIELKLNENPEKIQTENINAFIEGSDPVLKNEVVVVSAHYDHLGKNGTAVFNGADDNASGSAAILEMARIFNKMKEEGREMKRSVLFLWFTGEEHGLLGSEYYADHPLIPLAQTITNLNIDMIGRSDSLKETKNYTLFVIGSDRISMKLHQINEQANKSNQKMNLDYMYNEVNEPLRLYYRSDHYNFAKNGVPSIFYFGGFHADYHEVSDDVEKINFDKINEVVNLVSKTLFELLNTEDKVR